MKYEKKYNLNNYRDKNSKLQKKNDSLENEQNYSH